MTSLISWIAFRFDHNDEMLDALSAIIRLSQIETKLWFENSYSIHPSNRLPRWNCTIQWAGHRSVYAQYILNRIGTKRSANNQLMNHQMGGVVVFHELLAIPNNPLQFLQRTALFVTGAGVYIFISIWTLSIVHKTGYGNKGCVRTNHYATYIVYVGVAKNMNRKNDIAVENF